MGLVVPVGHEHSDTTLQSTELRVQKVYFENENNKKYRLQIEVRLSLSECNKHRDRHILAVKCQELSTEKALKLEPTAGFSKPENQKDAVVLQQTVQRN